MDLQHLVDLPIHVLMALSLGYIGYKAFSIGYDSHHKTYDTVFLILVFSLPTFVVRDIWSEFGTIILGLIALPLTVILALVARWALPSLQEIPKKLKLTTENFRPTTWHAIVYDKRNSFSIVAVQLIDGSWLESDLRKLPEKLPHYPCDFDPDGNVALYVTEVTDPTGVVREIPSNEVWETDAGAGITFIPKSQITRVLITKEFS